MRKLKNILLLLVTFTICVNMFSQENDDYIFFESKNGVSLFYKKFDGAILFKAKNNSKKSIYVKIYNLSANTSDGETTKKKNVLTGQIKAGETSMPKGIFTSVFNKNRIISWKLEKWDFRELSYPY